MEKAKWMHGDRRWMDAAGWILPALLVVLLGAATACSRPPPEERLRTALADMQQALEDREPARFMEHVAADFVGNAGVDRDALQQMVRGQLLLNQRIDLVLGPAEVELREDGASVGFSALVAGGGGRLLPERGGAWQVTTGWREEDGRWRLHYARWERH